MTNLKKGDKAPEFKGLDQDGNPVSLSDFRGKKLVLFFYPKDNTPTCTVEACNLRDNFGALQKRGLALLGVSPDSSRKHRNFIEKFNLPFPLLADTEKEVVQAYGVWGPKKMFGRTYDGVHRTTFIIDEKGFIEEVIYPVKAATHTDQILEALEENNV
ncbi:MAG: thioredoxin-dependent thiol peroxidase [Bacteroidetes bacterium]|nr:MAG: thioredoxin-dependent thiol peroxidase [Bacteroidota bacterium]